jgi:hypothetical protein
VSEDIIEYGGSRIWISNDAEVVRVSIETTKQQAKFWSGQVSERFAKRFIAARRVFRQRGARIPQETAPIICNPTRVRTCECTEIGSCEGTCAGSCEGTDTQDQNLY